MGAYGALKHLHLATVAISLGLFVLRGCWMLVDSSRLQMRWARVLPHVNDTVLLASALGLAALIQQYPFVNGWLTAKVVALLVYIGLGTIAIKRGRTKVVRVSALLGALLVFAYIVSVAIAHDPRGFFAA